MSLPRSQHMRWLFLTRFHIVSRCFLHDSAGIYCCVRYHRSRSSHWSASVHVCLLHQTDALHAARPGSTHNQFNVLTKRSECPDAACHHISVTCVTPPVTSTGRAVKGILSCVSLPSTGPQQHISNRSKGHVANLDLFAMIAQVTAQRVPINAHATLQRYTLFASPQSSFDILTV